MNDESAPTDTDAQLAKSKADILQMFLEETENLKASYQQMQESDIREPTKKEAILASLQILRVSTAKKSVRFLNPDGLFMEILFQFVSELGAAIDSIETAYRKKEEVDIDEPTRREAVLHPLNILSSDIQKALEAGG